MNTLINTFKLLSDETRLRIILLLQQEELCVCQLTGILDISQPDSLLLPHAVLHGRRIRIPDLTSSMLKLKSAKLSGLEMLRYMFTPLIGINTIITSTKVMTILYCMLCTRMM